MIDHQRTSIEDVFVGHDYTLGLHRRTRRVLEKQDIRRIDWRLARNLIHEFLGRDPRKTGNVINVDPGRRYSTSSEIGLEGGLVISTRQDSSRLAILCDVNHFVQGTLEATRTRGIDRHGDQSGAHATKKCADHFESWRVREQKTVACRETAFFP